MQNNPLEWVIDAGNIEPKRCPHPVCRHLNVGSVSTSAKRTHTAVIMGEVCKVENYTDIAVGTQNCIVRYKIRNSTKHNT
jgi:hypothetical protein